MQLFGWNRCVVACMIMLVCALTESPSIAQFARPLEGRVDPFARSRTRGVAFTSSSSRDREVSKIADYDPSTRTASFDQTTALGTKVSPAGHVQGWPSNRQIMPAPEDTWCFQWLPDSLIYKSYLAGVKEPRLAGTIGTGRSNIVDNHWLFEGNLGARVGIFRYGTQQAMLAQGFQMDVEGAGQVRLDPSDDVDVVATDYRAGVPLSYGWGNHQFKLAYYHVSSHLGDEYLIKRPDFPRLNFVRDVFVFGWSYYLNLDLRFYAEAGWAFKTDISEPWEFQFGIDWAPGRPTGIWGAPFFAINAHLREELNFGGNLNTQAGWAWRAAQGGRLFRAGLQYYNGASNQYSFYQYHENELSFGLWYDF